MRLDLLHKGDIWVDIRVNKCKTFIDMCTDTRVYNSECLWTPMHICTNTCADMCVDMCTRTCISAASCCSTSSEAAQET